MHTKGSSLFNIFLRLYLFIGQREKEHSQAGGAAEGLGEAASPLSREPNTGLDPRALRS